MGKLLLGLALAGAVMGCASRITDEDERQMAAAEEAHDACMAERADRGTYVIWDCLCYGEQSGKSYVIDEPCSYADGEKSAIAVARDTCTALTGEPCHCKSDHCHMNRMVACSCEYTLAP